MSEVGWLLLRLSLSITFIFAGLFIFRDPISWANQLKPWCLRFLPKNRAKMMKQVAIFDLLLGVWLLTPVLIWVAALLSLLHLIQVFMVVGIDKVTYRNIGLIGISIVLFLQYSSFIE